MNWPLIFALANALALVGWMMLAFLPRRPLVLSAIMYLTVFGLCALYAALFFGLITGAIDPGGAAERRPFEYSIGGIRHVFASDGGIVVGWTHYLAFDLFVGLWIAKDADAKGMHRLLQLPILFATLMAGPIGLLLYLIAREPRARAISRERRA